MFFFFFFLTHVTAAFVALSQIGCCAERKAGLWFVLFWGASCMRGAHGGVMGNSPERTAKVIFFGRRADHRISFFLWRIFRIGQLREQNRTERHTHSVFALGVGTPLVAGGRQDQAPRRRSRSGSSFLHRSMRCATIGLVFGACTTGRGPWRAAGCTWTQ